MLNQITIFGIISLINFLTCVFIGTFLFVKNSKNSINVTYCIFDFCIAFYAFFYFLWQSTSGPVLGVLFFKLCIVGVVLINSAFIHFSFVILGIAKKFKKRLLLIHLLNAFFCYGALNLFYADWKNKYTYGLWPIPSTTFHFYIFWWFFQVIYCFYLIYTHGILKSQGKGKKQYQWIFWATLIAYAGGATNWLVWYDVNFPPYLNSGIAIYTIVLAYAIFRYQLLDIEIIIKKTLVFTGLLSLFLFVFFALTYFLNLFITSSTGIHSGVAAFFAFAVGILSYHPFEKFLINATDKYLFQKKESVNLILNKLSENAVTILEIQKLGETILETLRDTLRLRSAAIIVKDENEEAYHMLDSFGCDASDLKFSKDDIFIQIFQNAHEILNLENPEVKNAVPLEVFRGVEKIDVSILMPLFFQKELIGILFLGKKKSDQDYSQEEIDYFPTVASQIALALRNAKLHDTIIKSQVEYAQQSKLAALGTLLAGISHEIKNPLNNIGGSVQAFLINHKNNMLAKMSREELTDFSYQVMTRVKEDVFRANEIIERLSMFAKKPKEIKFESIGVEQAIDNVLAMIGQQLADKNILVKKEYAPDLPKIAADIGGIEQVFLNLLVNAMHAIAETGTEGHITIKASTKKDEIQVTVRDNGKGIAKQNQEKIFDPFFTTKDTSRNKDPEAIKGSGLGLFLVREIIRKYGGRIVLESEVDKGTAFHIYFPISKD